MLEYYLRIKLSLLFVPLALVITLSSFFSTSLARAEETPAPPKKAAHEQVDDDERKALYTSLEKSEPLAGIMSGVLGFGAGSFYANSPEIVTIFLATDLALVVVGFAVPELSNVCLITFLSIRVPDILIAVLETGNYNDELNQQYQLGVLKKKLSISPGFNPATKSVMVGLSIHF